jgi:hypothetical protein
MLAIIAMPSRTVAAPPMAQGSMGWIWKSNPEITRPAPHAANVPSTSPMIAIANDLGRCEYAIRMIEECQLAAQDFWTPLAPGTTRAIDRKGVILKKG